MANCQLDYYVTKVRKLMEGIPVSTRNPWYLDAAIEKWEHKDRVQEFKFRCITTEETLNLISSLSESTARGHDGIDSIGIRDAANLLVGTNQNTVNMSPNLWKVCQEMEIFKSDSNP